MKEYAYLTCNSTVDGKGIRCRRRRDDHGHREILQHHLTRKSTSTAEHASVAEHGVGLLS